MHGAGNDFILIDNRKEGIPEEEMSPLVQRLCDRRRSIGADGVMFVDVPQKGGDFRMRFYNADGSLGEMCGNGARCITRYGYEHGLGGEELHIETTAGMVTGWHVKDNLYRVRLNDPTVLHLDDALEVDGKTYEVSYVELGEPGLPHAIVLLPDWQNRPQDELRELGRRLRNHPAFPKGANVSFVARGEDGNYSAITFERGVEDFTLACGTGAGSIAAVLTKKGMVPAGDAVRVQMPGGLLSVTLSDTDGRLHDIYLTGPAVHVMDGEIVDDGVISGS